MKNLTREQLAAKILTAHFSNPNSVTGLFHDDSEHNNTSLLKIAKSAVKAADALISVLINEGWE